MQKNYICGALIKQIHDEIEKKANALLRQQNLTLSQMNVLMELEAESSHRLSLKELEVFLSAPVPKAVMKNTIPAMATIGANGLAWAQPVADLLSAVLVVFPYLRTVKRMEANSRK